jgi:putative endonuclease
LKLLGGCWLYILRCSDDSYYVGTTRSDELETRVSQHNLGVYGGYTARRRPVSLVYSAHFERILDAIAAERQIKGWSRAKKEALIRGEFEALPGLAKRRTPFPGRDDGSGRDPNDSDSDAASS